MSSNTNTPWYMQNNLRSNLLKTGSAIGEDIAYRRSLADMVTDGDTINGVRLAGIDSMESVGFDANNEKAQKILDEYGISYEDQRKYGKQATDVLRQKILEGDYQFQNLGKDTLGRKLFGSQQLNEELLTTGLYAPTDRYDKRSQDLFRKVQEKTARLDAKQAEYLESQRQYNIEGQAPSVLQRLGAPIDAFQSGLQQTVAGTGDFLLDLLTPGNNTLLDQYASAEDADKRWGYNRKESEFQQAEMLNSWKNEDYLSALGTAVSMAPEVVGESLPMIGLMFTPTGFVRGAAVGSVKAFGATANAAKASGAVREANALKSFVKNNTNDGFLLAVGSTTNQHIDDFTANNNGVPPDAVDIARMTAVNALQLGLDKVAFSEITGLSKGADSFIKSMKPMAKILPENAIGSIATKVASTAMAMGTEASQEYVQTWAEILNSQLGTTKYKSLQDIISSQENIDQATVGALLGAGAGGAMRVHAIPMNAVADYWKKDKVALAQANENRANLHDQIRNGIADPHENPLSFTGKDTEASIRDINSMVTNAGNMPMEIAHAAIRETFPSDNTDLPEEGGSKYSTIDMIRNVDKSLRNAYKVAEDGTGDIENVAKYNEATYFSALQTLKNISSTKSAMKEHIESQGLKYDDTQSTKALSVAMEAYKTVLPAETMNQLMLSLATDTIEMIQSDAIQKGGEKTSASILSVGKEGQFEANIESLERALSRLNAISMGSMDTGAAAKEGTFSSKQVSDSLSKLKLSLESKIKEARASESGTVEIPTAFMDHLKGAMQVGSEILFYGKQGSDNTYGKGLYQYGIDIAKDIHKAGDALKDGKLNKELFNGFYKFATGRYKPLSIGENQDGVRFFNKSELKGTEIKGISGAKEEYKANYIKEQDLVGNIADKKIREAYHFITVAQQLKAALSATANIKDEDRASFNDHLNEIIEKQNSDIKNLRLDKDTALSRRGEDNTILIDVRSFLKTKAIKDPVTGKVIKEAEVRPYVEGLLKEAMASGKFAQDEPIYAAVQRSDIFPMKEKVATKPEKVEEPTKEATVKPKESETKALTSDNIEIKKEETQDEQNKQQTREHEAPREVAKSEESTEGAERRVEKTTTAPESEQVRLTPDVVATAEEELLTLVSETASIANEIASENGIDGFAYDYDLTAAENMRELRKLITAKINQYKKVAKVEIENSLGRIEKLSSLLTAAVKGEGLHGISINKNIQEAKRLHEVRATAGVSKNEEIKLIESRRKRIEKLLNRISTTSSIDNRLKTTKALASLLGIEYKTPMAKRPTGGFGKAQQDIENDEVPSYSYKDEYENWTEADIATFEADVVAMATKELSSDEVSEAEESYIEENHVFDMEDDGVSDVIGIDTNIEKDAQEVIVAPNIFSSMNVELIKTNNDKIAKAKADIKAYEQKRILEVATAMARDFSQTVVLTGTNFSNKVESMIPAAKERVKKEIMEGCL